MFEGIHKLPPGHSLVLEAGGTPRIERYWQLEQEPKLTGTEDQLCDELEARIEEALRLHLVSDVPVGAFLSGGMDSSLLVAMLARKLGVRELPTFTMGLDYQRFDEAPAARAVAQMFGTQHHEERVKPEITALLPDLVAALDEPSDPLSLCTWLLARFTRRHVKVVIGGDGGDELFGGYDRYYGNLYASHYGKVPETLRRRVLAPAVALIPESGWYKSVGHQLRWLHHLSFHSGGARYAASLSYFYFDRERRAELFAPQVAARWQQLDAESAIRAPYEAAPGNAPLDRMLFADSMVRLPNHPVMITDRICMAHGLEARSPFMDHELAAFAARLAPALKVRGGSLRYIQRKLAARYLPPQILNRPKQGFSSALPYLLQREYAQLYSSCLRDSRLARDRILDGRRDGAIGRRAPGEACRPWQSAVAADQRGSVVSDADPRRVQGRAAARARLPAAGTESRSQPMKNWLRISITVLACALLLIFVVDERAVLHTLARCDPLWALIALGAFTLDRVLMSFKWGLLLAIRGYRVTLTERLMVYCSSMMWGLALPSTVGADGIRILLVRRLGVRVDDSLATILVERGLGFVSALLMGVMSLLLLRFLVPDAAEYDVPLLIGIASLLLAIALLLLSFHSKAASSVLNLLPRRVAQSAAARLVAGLHEAYRSLASDRRRLSLFFALTVVEQLLVIVCYGLIAFACS
jgi:asparagine synthase (glutamine-hydrolysing)